MGYDDDIQQWWNMLSAPLQEKLRGEPYAPIPAGIVAEMRLSGPCMFATRLDPPSRRLTVFLMSHLSEWIERQSPGPTR